MSAVLPTWAPRDEAWRARGPSRWAGRADRPLFIGACPRSGTTLLRSMLDNHPDLAMPAETDFVIPLWKRRAAFGDLREAANRRRVAEWVFLQDGRGGRRLRAGRVSREEAIAHVVAAPPTLGSVLAACLEVYARAHGKPRWGDKKPAYATRVAMIFALFPDAQFVHLVRDPRAAVASQLPLGWDTGEAAAASAAVRWETSVRRVDAFARRLRPDQLLDLRYEDMVADPRAAVGEVCAFAGLPSDGLEAMVEGERRGSFRPGWHDKLAQPVATDSVERWRQTLDAREVAVAECVAGDLLARLGYRAVAGSRVGDADRAMIRAERARRRRRWRREAWDERKRRWVLDRGRPLARVC